MYWHRRFGIRWRRNWTIATELHRRRFILLAAITLALSLLDLSGPAFARIPPATAAKTSEPAQPPAKDNDEESALKEFQDAYHLEPGQILKRIPRPRPEGMRIWAKRNQPGRDMRLSQVSAMTFKWQDPAKLTLWSSRYSGDQGFDLKDLLRYLGIDVHAFEMDGDRELLDTIIPGDWVYRQEATDAEKVHALESILQRVLRLRISLTFREVERDVVVVKGQYHYTPEKGRSNNEIEIYAKQIVPGGGGFGGGGGTFHEFLKWVGDWINRPVISDLATPPKGQFGWSYNGRMPFTKETQREDHDETLVLQHLHEQTGLTYTRERRPIRILFVERAKAIPSP
jgi:hypothetical protein